MVHFFKQAERSQRRWLIIFCLFAITFLAVDLFGAGGSSRFQPLGDEGFPVPRNVDTYEDDHLKTVWDVLVFRAKEEPFNVVATIIFFCAILHTFLTSYFRKIEHRIRERHLEEIEVRGRTARHKNHPDAKDDVSFWATACHFLGEIEAVFGIWVVPLILAALFFYDFDWMAVTHYLDTRNYTEPMFVVVVMAIASTRPIIQFSERVLKWVASIGRGTPTAWWFSILTFAPLLGSFITEPAAMTIAAFLLGNHFYMYEPSERFKYATLGLLFVNISVGGTLTHFAAPPVLMVAGTWGWTMPYMFSHFGWKFAIGIIIANITYYFLFRNEFRLINKKTTQLEREVRSKHIHEDVPFRIILVQLCFLAWTVFNLHHPALFIGGFLFFMAFAEATAHHQNPVYLKAPLLVGFFLAGLVIHGGLQQWWIEPVLSSLSEVSLFLSSIGLTAFNDNAAITYLASLVPEFAGNEALQQAVVGGAVVGGGLTVIANAPNPAGQSILSTHFENGISPLKLLMGALWPTIVMGLCFKLIPLLY